ncbi:hypothetical protein LMG28140_06762 [Paraburkholderia metrosideri]|jgi:hypothetical protein|uniref:Uncharacterized protein n=1 Tax=Paraburkholderia metrosideri TaxID=580937 RepID=A0ABN7IDY4_9BURK|nr:hypothetical protein LMG28140_06762 [Paraburkholderia metrosideri]
MNDVTRPFLAVCRQPAFECRERGRVVVALAITLLLTTIAPLNATAADSAAGSATGDLSGAFGDWRYSARTNEGKQLVAAYSRVRDRDAITRASTQVFNGKMP